MECKVEKNVYYNGKSARYSVVNAKDATLPEDSKVVIYGWNRCPFTMRAVNVAKGLPGAITFYDVGDCREEVRAMLGRTFRGVRGHKTIPIVFVNGNFVGGCDDFLNGLKMGFK